MRNIYAEIVAIFKETLQLEEGVAITPEATFAELDIDSLDLLEVVTAIEDHYEIEISDEVLSSIKTAGDAADCVENLINEA